MMKKNDIQQRVEDTLESLEGIQRVSPAPFFYTRLKSRLEQAEKSIWESISSFIARPSIVFATICMILLLNITVLFKKRPTEISSSSDQNEQTLNNAYDVASSTNSTILNIWSQDNEQHIKK